VRALVSISSLLSVVIGAILIIVGLTQISSPHLLPFNGNAALLQYLAFMAVSAGVAFIGIFSAKLSPLQVGLSMAVGLALLSGKIWPLLMTLWFFYSSVILGNQISILLRINSKENLWMSFLVGAGIYGTVVGFFAHFEINYPGVYAVGLTLPIIVFWQATVEHWRIVTTKLFTKDLYLSHKWLDGAIVIVAMVHFVIALMPEIGHDALAMHLFIPAHMASRHQWGFDVGTYVWAVMPMLGDWIFTIGYMLAGEVGARLINIGFIFMIGRLVFDLALWAGSSGFGARWGALIFLSTPLTFTESSSLFIESVWSAFLVGGILILLMQSNEAIKSKSYVWLATLLLGFAMATKAVTITIMPIILALYFYKFLRDPKNFSMWITSCILFLAISLIPYITAWWLTSNPVFPFFNGIFQSAYYPPVNFDASSRFGSGLTWDILYRVTFDSGKYLEATSGVSGFQWLLLFIPTVIFIVIGKDRRGGVLLLIGILIIFQVFYSTAYLRYVFPAWAILSAAIGLGLAINLREDNLFKIIFLGRAVIVVVLNMLFLSSGAQYRDFPLRSIWDSTNRDVYLRERLPIRNAVELINIINQDRSRVAVFASPMTASLESDALYANWYNFKFQSEINAINRVEDLVRILLERNVTLVILDDNWDGGPKKRDLIIKATELVMEYGTISVRKVRSEFRFMSELIKNPNFLSIDGWSFASGAQYDANSNIIIASVAQPVSQEVKIAPERKYLNSVVSRCLSSKAMGRIQINWLDADKRLIKADIKTFNCTSDWVKYDMEVISPPNANLAIVYVTGHTDVPLLFKSNSLRQ
jgi:hypothetical protein